MKPKVLILGIALLSTSVFQSQADIEISTAACSQKWPAVAWDGTNYLVVWTDEGNWQNTGYDIYGVRVRAAGEILDLIDIDISDALDIQSAPSVAASG